MKELAEFEKLSQKFESAKREAFLSGPYDQGEAVLTVVAGAGGDDAEDWARILLEMYQKYSGRQKWGVKTIHTHFNELNGIKNATIEIQGKHAYGYLKNETGVHRLVRISHFDANKRRHTSFALVQVMPKFVDPGEVEIKDEDLDVSFAKAGGPGGQNVNKVSTAVRLKHIPTGITVTAQTERSQLQNRENALKLLRAKLWVLQQAEKNAQTQSLKGTTQASWGTQIRSYVLHPYHMVKDLRTLVETSNTESVLDGDLNQFIDAEIRKG